MASQTVTVSATKADSTGGSTTMTVPGTHSTATEEELAVKEADTEAESRPEESSQRTTASVQEPIGRQTKEEIQATATLTATTTTTTTMKEKDEGLSSAEEKTSYATDDGMKTEDLDQKKDQTHTDKAQCLEGECVCYRSNLTSG